MYNKREKKQWSKIRKRATFCTDNARKWKHLKGIFRMIKLAEYKPLNHTTSKSFIKIMSKEI